ncbi:MAG: hypothetical protein OEY52_10540 [Gammaproteobacteria bacterium]|nr:hypothetical protein [Gammaproteobacteria bacterium]
MEELLKKISSYNLFNYLFPGILFSVFVDNYTKYTLRHDDIFTSLFIFYFVGLVISRFGSLFIEPAFIKLRLIQYAGYKEFLSAEKEDKKIGVLLEQNNVYRTICSMLVLMFIVIGYEKLSIWLEISIISTKHMFGIVLLVMFVFSYRKQTRYIKSRIERNKK